MIKESIERILRIKQEIAELEVEKEKLESELCLEKSRLKTIVADLGLGEEAVIVTIESEQFVVMQGHGGAGFPVIVRVRSS